MVEITLTEDGPNTFAVADETWESGDTRDVDDRLAKHLTDSYDYFVRESESNADDVAAEDTDDEDEDEFDENEWLETHYQTRASTVRSGGADEYLDDIEDVDDTDAVLEAVENRRDALETEDSSTELE